MEAVFADTREGIGSVVHRAVLAEFDEFDAWRRAASSSGVGSGSGSASAWASGSSGDIVEAALEEFFGSGEAVAGLEVGEFTLHGVDEEADGGAAIVGFLADDLGELGADVSWRRFGFRFRIRIATGIEP